MREYPSGAIFLLTMNREVSTTEAETPPQRAARSRAKECSCNIKNGVKKRQVLLPGLTPTEGEASYKLDIARHGIEVT